VRRVSLYPYNMLPVRRRENAEMLADVRAYDAAKPRLEDGEDELIRLALTERPD